MRPTSVRSLVAVAVLVAASGIVVFGDWVRAQSSTPAESAVRAKQAAKDWALKIFTDIGQRANEDKRITFQPLSESDLVSSRHRRRLYGLLLSALHEQGKASGYTVKNPMDLEIMQRALESAAVEKKLREVAYMKTLQEKRLTKLNLSCKGSPDRNNRIKLECTALDIDNDNEWGRASAVFEMDWLGAPLAMETAFYAVAGEIVAVLRGSARVGEVKIVEADNSRSNLTRFFEKLLRRRVLQRLGTKSPRGQRSVGGSAKKETRYRLAGSVDRLKDKLVLFVDVYKNDETWSFYVAEEHITLDSVETLLEAGRVKRSQPVDEAARGEVVAKKEKHALHEAVKAGDMARVKELLEGGADVNGRDGGHWTGLMHAASSGYMLVVKLLLDKGADVGLQAVKGETALYMASEKGELGIVRMLLEAGAETEVMGPRGRRAADAAEEGGYTKIVELLKGAEAERALRAEAQKDDEAYGRARGLDTPAAYRQYEKERPGGRHRAAVRDRLRELDEAAYGKARGLDTVEGWAEYRRAFPEGFRAKEAREKEWELRERGLGLKHPEQVSIQRGLASLGKDVGQVDGWFGDRTRGAIGEWQGEKGLAVTGYLTGDQARALRALGEAAEREEAKRRARLERERKAREAREAAERKAREEREREERRMVTRLKELQRRNWPAGESFRECRGCPEMVVIPAGEFMMGSPASEEGRDSDEGPQHRVRIGRPIAVGKYEVTFEEWDACVAGGGCRGYRPSDEGWGRGRQPVINVSWEDAKAYVRWLMEKTGKEYRLLSEAEWEYMARARTETRYSWSWGYDEGNNKANCAWCGSRWDDQQTAPVGSFEANGFGLHDVHGNVWEWVEDCRHDDYAGAPTDGSAWTSGGNCGHRVSRGGSWFSHPWDLRSANRNGFDAGYRSNTVGFGFRVARTLAR